MGLVQLLLAFAVLFCWIAAGFALAEPGGELRVMLFGSLGLAWLSVLAIIEAVRVAAKKIDKRLWQLGKDINRLLADGEG